MQDDGNDPSYVGLQSTANPSQLILLGRNPTRAIYAPVNRDKGLGAQPETRTRKT